jgi:hypothetical protein
MACPPLFTFPFPAVHVDLAHLSLFSSPGPISHVPLSTPASYNSVDSERSIATASRSDLLVRSQWLSHFGVHDY